MSKRPIVDTTKHDKVREIIPAEPLPYFSDKREYAGLLVGLAAQDDEVMRHLREIVNGMMDDGSWDKDDSALPLA